MSVLSEREGKFLMAVNIVSAVLVFVDMLSVTDIIQIPFDVLATVNLAGIVVVAYGFLLKKKIRDAAKAARRAEAEKPLGEAKDVEKKE